MNIEIRDCNRSITQNGKFGSYRLNVNGKLVMAANKGSGHAIKDIIGMVVAIIEINMAKDKFNWEEEFLVAVITLDVKTKLNVKLVKFKGISRLLLEKEVLSEKGWVTKKGFSLMSSGFLKLRKCLSDNDVEIIHFLGSN